MAGPYGTRILSGRLNPKIAGLNGFDDEDPILYDPHVIATPTPSQPAPSRWIDSLEAWGVADPKPAATPDPNFTPGVDISGLDGGMSLQPESKEWWDQIDSATGRKSQLPTVDLMQYEGPTEQERMLPIVGGGGQQVKFDPAEGPDVAAAAKAFAANPQLYPELSGVAGLQSEPQLLPNLTANPKNLESGTEDMLRNEVSKLDLQAKAHEAAAAGAAGLATNPYTITSGQMKQNLLGTLVNLGVGYAAGGGGKLGLGLGLAGAGDASTAFFNDLEAKDKEYRAAQMLKAKTESQAAQQAQAQAQGLVKEVAKNQMSMDRLEKEDKLISGRQSADDARTRKLYADMGKIPGEGNYDKAQEDARKLKQVGKGPEIGSAEWRTQQDAKFDAELEFEVEKAKRLEEEGLGLSSKYPQARRLEPDEIAKHSERLGITPEEGKGVLKTAGDVNRVIAEKRLQGENVRAPSEKELGSIVSNKMLTQLVSDVRKQLDLTPDDSSVVRAIRGGKMVKWFADTESPEYRLYRSLSAAQQAWARARDTGALSVFDVQMWGPMFEGLPLLDSRAAISERLDYITTLQKRARKELLDTMAKGKVNTSGFSDDTDSADEDELDRTLKEWGLEE